MLYLELYRKIPGILGLEKLHLLMRDDSTVTEELTKEFSNRHKWTTLSGREVAQRMILRRTAGSMYRSGAKKM